MKKYMKPLMESEMFVANEYVAACYGITCTNCGKSFIYKGSQPIDDGSGDSDSEDFNYAFRGDTDNFDKWTDSQLAGLLNLASWYYRGTELGTEYCESIPIYPSTDAPTESNVHNLGRTGPVLLNGEGAYNGIAHGSNAS